MGVTALARYITRIAPALALLGFSLLLWKSFASLERPSGNDSGSPQDEPRTNFWQFALSVYLVALHVSTALIPFRAFRALGHVSAKMKEVAADLPRLRSSALQRDLRFAIIIPAYKETVDTLRTTLSVLASHPQARSSYDVYLAMEEREKGSQAKAKRLQDLYRDCFHSMNYTVHPQIVGEAPGKSSNQSWAGKQLIKDYNSLPSKGRPEVLVTTMDSDSHLSWRYFAQVAEQYSAVSDPNDRTATFYISPVVFDRNANEVPLLVRTADIYWTAAGLSTMYEGSPTSIPTSVYTLPLTLLEDVGGWDTDYTAIGEDMHMYLKCFFALNGNLRSNVILAASSQCNVCSELKGLRGSVDGIRARYQQANRHLWGMLDTGFAIRLTVNMVAWKCTVWWTKLVGVLNRILRTHDRRIVLSSFETGSLDTQGSQRHRSRTIHYSNVRTLFRRLVEAHLVPLQMLVALAVPGIFQVVCSKVPIPYLLAMSLQICGILRILGMFLLLALVRRYNVYYRICTQLRAEDMREGSKRHPDCAEADNEFKAYPQIKSGVLEAVASPIVGLLFVSLPALQATIMQLFTIKLQYVVSAKPLFAKVASIQHAERGVMAEDSRRSHDEER